MKSLKSPIAHVQFYYDIVSPYSYLAFETLMKYKKIWNIHVELKPVFLGAIMKATNNKPPASNPVKGLFLLKDLERSAKLCNLNLKIPLTHFPANTMTVQCILTCIKESTLNSVSSPCSSSSSTELLENVTRAFWINYWGNDRNIQETHVIESVLENIPELLAAFPSQQTASSAKGFLESFHSKEKEMKQKLKETTQEALNYGAFGVPAIVIKKLDQPDTQFSEDKEQMFFGNDRFEHIADYLNVRWFGYSPESAVSSKL